MAEFAPFIASSTGAAAFGAWHRRIAFGDALPSGRCSGLVHLEVDTVADAGLQAPFAGKLSTRQPTGFLQPAFEAVIDSVPNAPAITLFLEPVAAKLGPLWFIVSDRITGAFQPAASEAAKINALADFVFHNVDAESARTLVLPKLRTAFGKKPSDDELWRRFLAGESAVTVKGGEPLGRVAALQPGGTLHVAVGVRTAFGMYDPGQLYADIVEACSIAGVTAPVGAAALGNGPLQSQRPLIARTRSIADVGADRLWPWSALLQYKQANALAYADWRALGNAQKALYLAQLRARTRPGSAPSGTPRFAYDVDDLANLFQLESVVEFYANFPDPWRAGSQPVTSGTGYRTVNFLAPYGRNATASGKTVTLDGQLDLTRVMPGRDTIALDADTARDGRQYRIMAVDRANQVVTVDAAPQMAGGSAWRIYDNATLVQIDAFGSRVRGAHAAATGANALELTDLAPAQLAALAQVNKFETVELFDAPADAECAARLTAAPHIDAGNHKATLQLDRTLATPAAGSAWGIPAGVGGVQQPSVDVVLQKKTGIVPHYLQSLTPEGPASVWGFDQYDGMLFMVAAGEVRAHFPWTSYTSRAFPRKKKRPPEGVPANGHSSIEGNALYRYGSAFSTNDYINAGFRIIDTDGFLWTDDAQPQIVAGGKHAKIAFGPDAKAGFVRNRTLYFLWPDPPRFRLRKIHVPDADDVPDPALDDLFVLVDSTVVPASPAPYWVFVHPGNRKAHYYFTDEFDDDTCPPDKVPGGAPISPPLRSGDEQYGKVGIFIHKGEQTYSGSLGCQVSPSFMSLRAAMIRYDAEANATLYATPGGRPRFQDELHWEQHKPALIQHFLDLDKQLSELQPQLAAKLFDPLKSAIDATLRKKGAKARLTELAKQIDKAKAQPTADRDVGEGPTQQEVIDTLQAILDGANDQNVQQLLKDAQKQEAEAIKLRAGPLQQQCDQLAADIDKEIQSYGWNDAMHGEYWLIRPDERAS